jgi:hypothetical protein
MAAGGLGNEERWHGSTSLGLAFRRQPNSQRCPAIFHAKWTAGSFRCNFIKIHRTPRTSPAMAAGVTDRLWSVEDLVALWGII